MAGTLFIYDTHDPDNVRQARGRFSASAGVTEIATDSVAELLARLHALRRRGATFDRVLVQTHGVPGAIAFGSTGAIIEETWSREFGNQGFEQMFPTYTRIYFDECEVAAGDKGTRFLIEAGRAFLRRGAGEVLAYPDPGYGFPGGTPLVGGHTIHLAGRLKTAYFLAGGILHGVTESRSAAEKTAIGVHMAFRR